MSESLLTGPVSPPSRRRYPLQFKRQVVQESLVPGVSIASVAMLHGINTNLLHNWRWQYRRGDFEAVLQEPVLLPVAVDTQPHRQITTKHIARKDLPDSERPAAIELIIGDARLSIHDAADPATLRCIIEALRR